MRYPILFCALLIAPLPGPAHAAVEDVGATGFTVVERADITASPDQIYQAVIAPSRWWSSEHTYSQDAANLLLDPKAGGCWCETLPNGGSVQHMTVVTAMPGKLLRLRGALGPLQSMAVDGAMTFALQPDDKTTHLTLTYTVGGYATAGFSDVANAVDRVLGEQLSRLNHFVETGYPNSTSQLQTKE